mmetsp:Transcript_76311/g.247118  ORF Transcript_76311/g.247118 Transcript_76311/m.247118 type:complete len:110 (-) Transcript_76311:506-835(-)
MRGGCLGVGGVPCGGRPRAAGETGRCGVLLLAQGECGRCGVALRAHGWPRACADSTLAPDGQALSCLAGGIGGFFEGGDSRALDCPSNAGDFLGDCCTGWRGRCSCCCS